MSTQMRCLWYRVALLFMVWFLLLLLLLLCRLHVLDLMIHCVDAPFVDSVFGVVVGLLLSVVPYSEYLVECLHWY